MNPTFNISIGDGYILAAEDSLVQAKKLIHLFDLHKLKHKIVKNGAEGLEEAAKEKPVMIISDIVMPVMDGYEFCSKIKSDATLKDVPVILLTSLSDPLDIIKGLQAGADNFITKPYEEAFLMARINYLLANKQFRKMGMPDPGIDIVFQKQRFHINSDKKQILDLLLSVYEAAVSRNSQLIEAQKQLQVLNEDLRSANEELESFARTVSHDLRSPLNGIKGFADLLQLDYSEMIGPDGNEYLDFIIKSAQNMGQLIDDLLQFSRSSRSEIVPESVNLSSMAKEIISDLRLANYQGTYQIEVEEDLVVFADPNMMRVVLTNLLSNALKYSQKATSPEVTFASIMQNRQKIYYVRDNGAGFDMMKADALFKPFIRLHSNSEFQGTGVGLSTVKRIIERHHGSIWFESEPQKGAIFFFTLAI